MDPRPTLILECKEFAHSFRGGLLGEAPDDVSRTRRRDLRRRLVQKLIFYAFMEGRSEQIGTPPALASIIMPVDS